MRFSIITLCLVFILMVTTYCVNAYNVIKNTRREAKVDKNDVGINADSNHAGSKRSMGEDKTSASKQVKVELSRREFLDRRKQGHAVHERITNIVSAESEDVRIVE
ncbi:uncharacterized protein EV154DRAFT_534052 [Mucor mucedo]|uniref:uncharacterized protein n=1 Tax=Mucor mucedo TaxID=29922 RepID=UPI00221F8B1F|nr:uncharacterized protein EV154DRAFT_534052 [Mucor mucedo]KAI7864395.1 hypothetical protein EV154DRAFT_534052 [Mucor mucedo]